MTRRGRRLMRRKMDTVLATWNVRALKRPGKLKEIREEMDKYGIKIGALQEIRWKGPGTIVSGNHILMYSGVDTGSKGVGFLLHKSMKPNVINFTAINDRMCSMRLRAKLFNVTIFCVYAPTEETEEEEKDKFYTKMEEEINKVQRHDVKMILGDLNAKIGREEVYRSTIGKASLHEDSNYNGLRLIDFAVEKKMIIKSTWQAQKDIKKETWVSPDGITRNQVDHVIVDR
jgi:exonuclease III